MCNNQLFLFALDGLLPRSTIQEVFILRQVCKQGQEKIDKVLQQGVNTKDSSHIIRSSMHLYKLSFSFYDYGFDLDWVCYPWWSNVNFVCYHCPDEGESYVARHLSWALNPTDKGAKEAVDGTFSFMTHMLTKAFPEFRPFYGDQVFNVE